MRFDDAFIGSVLRSIVKRIAATRLDLSGLTILTEAATGVYCITPVIAAMAGAKEVIAYAKNSVYGSTEDVKNDTRRLLKAVNKPLPIEIVDKVSSDGYGKADIITNTGHLRPITAEQVMAMMPGAVIPLMYESWELRRGDVDLAACNKRGIRVAGTNERHGLLDVFSFLGPLIVKALHSIFIPVVESRIVVLSDNAFGLPITRHLVSNQAEVFCVGPSHAFPRMNNAISCGDLREAQITSDIDACVIATTPSATDNLTYSKSEVTEFISRIRTASVVHLWGDIEYETLKRSNIVFVPPEPVREGHQGLSMGSIGPEPVIRLVVGGLKVGEALSRGSQDPFDLEFCQKI